jgi:hypothetical protein
LPHAAKKIPQNRSEFGLRCGHSNRLLLEFGMGRSGSQQW